MDLSSDCLFIASPFILDSTFLTSFTGSRLNTSSGSMPAQSLSPSFACASLFRLALAFGVDVPDEEARSGICEALRETKGDDDRLDGSRAKDPFIIGREGEASEGVFGVREVEGENGPFVNEGPGVERTDILRPVTC